MTGYFDLTTFAGIGGNGAAFIDSNAPQPFIYAYFIHVRVVLRDKKTPGEHKVHRATAFFTYLLQINCG
jgi:hypothetical protein